MPRIATIGVYEFDAASFIEMLDGANVSQLIDIRQRRGVRGSQYAWANAQRLQRLLADAGIGAITRHLIPLMAATVSMLFVITYFPSLTKVILWLFM